MSSFNIANLVTSILPQLFIGGALFSLISILINRRSEKRKLAAQARKTSIEADSEFVATAKELVGSLREELEVQRLLVVELQERVRLADKQVALQMRQTARLTSDLTHARSELVSARAELASALAREGKPPASR